ncbi:survival motor neuron protein isoform a, partial [Daubentonia madagascariensis]
EILG